MAATDIFRVARCRSGRRLLSGTPLLALLICPLLLGACSGGAPDTAGGGDETPDRLVGGWRAEFTSGEAQAPFTLTVRPSGGELSAVIVRGGEEVPVSSIARRDLVVTIRVTQPEAEIFAKMAPNGGSMAGFWREEIDGGVSELPFKAWRMDPDDSGEGS